IARLETVRNARIGEWSTGIQNLIDKIIVGAAVNLIGAGAHGDVEESAAHTAEFRSVVAGLDRNLLNRVDAGLCLSGGVGEALGSRILAFDLVGLRVGGRAVDL